MIKSYALPIGKQTAESYKYLANGWVVAAMAWNDTVSQEKIFAASFATEKAVELTVQYLPYDYDGVSIKSMLRTVLNGVANQLAEQAELKNAEVSCCDVQLTIAVYDGTNVIYANAGNGSIIGLTTFGEYINIALPSIQVNNCTASLFAGNEYWDIGHSSEEVVSIAVINEPAGRIFLSEHPATHECDANGLVCMPFMDPNCVLSDTIEKVEEKAKKLIHEDIFGDTHQQIIRNLFCTYGFDKNADSESILQLLTNKNVSAPPAKIEPEMWMRVFCDLGNATKINPDPMSLEYYQVADFVITGKEHGKKRAPILPKFKTVNNVKSYAVSLKGKAHDIIDKPCQDASDVITLTNGAVLAVAADGVGSAKNSADGSRLAVEAVTDLFKKCCPYHMDPISIKSIIRTSFNAAMGSIIRAAKAKNEDLLSYDTTLMVVVYCGDKAYYGFCGDGGIFVLKDDGCYEVVTIPQKGADGESVIPIRGGVRRWLIDDMPENTRSILIVTDGLLDALTPYYPGRKNVVYMLPTMVLMDPAGVDYCESDDDIQMRITHFLKGKLEKQISDSIISRIIYKYLGQDEEAIRILDGLLKSTKMDELIRNVYDDITAVAIIDLSKPIVSREPSYYEEPDWEAFYREWRKVVYPHLYGDQIKKDDSISKNSHSEETAKIESGSDKQKESMKTESGFSKENIEAEIDCLEQEIIAGSESESIKQENGGN